jgi:hypothetical protein
LAATGANPAGFDSGLQTGKQFSIKITNDAAREQKKTYIRSFVGLLLNTRLL